MDQYAWSRLFLAHSYVDYKYQPPTPQSAPTTSHHETVREEERNQILEINALVETGQGGIQRNVIKALGILRSVCFQRNTHSMHTHSRRLFALWKGIAGQPRFLACGFPPPVKSFVFLLLRWDKVLVFLLLPCDKVVGGRIRKITGRMHFAPIQWLQRIRWEGREWQRFSLTGKRQGDQPLPFPHPCSARAFVSFCRGGGVIINNMNNVMLQYWLLNRAGNRWHTHRDDWKGFNEGLFTKV